MSDPRLVRFTGLWTYPQHRYEWDEFRKRFPKGTFVPGLYMSYDLYEEIDKPERYRTIYIARDPRDIVVSWYRSMKSSHVLMGKVGKYRTELELMSVDAGLHNCIDALALKFAAIRTWYKNSDELVKIVKFEALRDNPHEAFMTILDWCELDVPGEVVVSVLDDYTKAKMRERDLRRRHEGEESHYRLGGSDHRTSFPVEHYRHFERVAGDLVDVMGY